MSDVVKFQPKQTIHTDSEFGGCPHCDHTELRTDLAKTWLANMITLTPGTLTLYVSEDRQTLYIHTLDIDDTAKIAASIRGAFETKLLELEK